MKYLITILFVFIGVFGMTNSASAVWTYEQDFNALNTATLNGQDSWSVSQGSTANWQVVEGTAGSGTYEGAKAVAVTPSGGWNKAIRTVSVSVGSFYIAVKTDNVCRFYLTLEQSGSTKMKVSFHEGSSSVTLYDWGGGGPTSIGTSISGTWGVVNYEFDDTGHDNEYRARYHNGTSWGSWSAWVGTNGTYTTIDQMEFQMYSDGSGVNSFDIITATDPTPEPVPPVASNQQSEFWFYK